jgi:hypothetical protein
MHETEKRRAQWVAGAVDGRERTPRTPLAPAEKESAAPEYQHYEDDDEQSVRVHFSLRGDVQRCEASRGQGCSPICYGPG